MTSTHQGKYGSAFEIERGAGIDPDRREVIAAWVLQQMGEQFYLGLLDMAAVRQKRPYGLQFSVPGEDDATHIVIVMTVHPIEAQLTPDAMPAQVRVGLPVFYKKVKCNSDDRLKLRAEFAIGQFTDGHIDPANEGDWESVFNDTWDTETHKGDK